MTHEEWLEWIEYLRLHPPEPERQDLRVARLCLVTAQCAGNADVKLSDFMPDYRKARASQGLSDVDLQIVNALGDRFR